jgi:hypothetical protein
MKYIFIIYLFRVLAVDIILTKSNLSYYSLILTKLSIALFLGHIVLSYYVSHTWSGTMQSYLFGTTPPVKDAISPHFCPKECIEKECNSRCIDSSHGESCSKINPLTEGLLPERPDGMSNPDADPKPCVLHPAY